MEWMFMPLKRYADFSGRSRRKEYWMWFLFNMAVTIVLYGIILASVIPAAMQSETGEPNPGVLAGLGLAGVILLLYAVATFIPNLAVTVRRLHDQDKSGWLFLLVFIPFVGPLILLVFMMMEGTKGDNKYGPDPKAGSVIS